MSCPPDAQRLLAGVQGSAEGATGVRGSGSSGHMYGACSAIDNEENYCKSDGESDGERDSEDVSEWQDGAFDLHEGDSLIWRVRVLISASYPVIIALLLSVSVNCIILFFAGYLSRLEDNPTIYSGVSLAITFANVTFCSIIDGLTTAVETLSSQYNGCKNYHMVGLTLNRSIILLSMLSCITTFGWLFADSLFLRLGVDRGTCWYMSQYLRIRVFAIPAEICVLSYEKYLMSLGLMRPTMFSAFLYTVILAIAEAIGIFVYQSSIGVKGLAWVFVLCTYIEIIAMVSFSINHPYVQRTIIFPTAEAFTNLGDFFMLGLPGCVMVCAEWWAFEILIVFASLIGTYAITSVSVIFQLLILCFMFPLGVGISASSMVGNALGAGQVTLAKDISRLALSFMLSMSVVICPTIIYFGPTFMELFSTDPTVIETSSSLIYLLAYSTMMDGLQGVGSGILRGAGKQHVGARINLVAYYLIGLPCAWVLCFHCSLGVHGLMYGICIGSSLQAWVVLYMVLFKHEYVFSRLKNLEEYCPESDL